MGGKKNRHDKAARRHAKAVARRNRQQLEDDNDDVPKMKYQLEKLGLALKEVEGDGNCLFRALSDQMYGKVERYRQLRKETVAFMREHREDFEPFHPDEGGVSFDRHLDLLAEDATYAGNDALVAFARAFKVTIVIHQLNEPLWQIHGGPDGSPCGKELHVSYHNGDHYNSVRLLGELCTSFPPGIQISTLDGKATKRQNDANEEAAENGIAQGGGGIWDVDGTGSRIFGEKVAEEVCESQPWTKVSAKTRKKREKRLAQDSKDEDGDGVSPAMGALSL